MYIGEELKKQFRNAFKFSKNDDINKFILLLRKAVYPYEYMDKWENFNETTLSEKDNFYSNLTVENITDSDYDHAKWVCNDFEIKDLGEYYDLYIAIGWCFWKLNKNVMCLGIYDA